MQLRRTAATLTGAAFALILAASPVAAHEGHEEGPRGQNKDVFTIQCDRVGDLTIQVTSAGEGRGVGRIIEGGKGVVIPTVAVFEVRSLTTGRVFASETEEFAPGQRKMQTTTCRSTFFTGTLAQIQQFDPQFAQELRGLGVGENEQITAEVRAEVLLRGPIARSGR